jgi:GH24 family phage-related lysozyme (muramidase)
MLDSQRKVTELHEGRVLHAYRDSLDFWTVGVGRLIDVRKGASLPASILYQLDQKTRAEFRRLQDLPLSVKKNVLAKLTDAQVDALYTEDLLKHQTALLRSQPWVASLDSVRRAVLDDMCFNMGTEPFDNDGIKDWPTFLRQVKTEQYKAAAANMRGTLWAKQVGKRAVRLATMMETGQWPKS